ncbi:hypothetical protein PDG61_00520 [Mycolicibacterium sp. BiH015]|uniref:hypothetical protein n=1 Tax=Mycolicibacterium sp. BiH015 TaxID=3018808 RepID=UPI0022E7B4C4|nr:hypothetical protein [Mycolicibacterium sp. BiH015]MDA2889385.1 hypothetical protein [Mycolicibacterium sp. BiH015]
MSREHSRDDMIHRSSMCARWAGRASATVTVVVGAAVAFGSAAAFAQPVDDTAFDPFARAAAQTPAPPADDADPAAVAACQQFAAVLQGTSLYYGQFADALETYEDPDYSTPSISTANVLGRTALRQGAGLALGAANTPGLAPDIAGPMRSWSLGATKLLLKMGLRTSGETLNLSVAELNADATTVQTACAAAGTHA